ncbi:hypothetical protein MW887_007758 [Aspergillus wentii]|nr:hypothetical protein MW887_007758 [Aspergillus wentii]
MGVREAQSSLEVIFGHQLSTADTALTRQCLELLRQNLGVEFIEVTREDADKASGEGHGFVNLSTTSHPLQAIQTIANALSEIGRTRESEVLDHVLYLCSEDHELGGLSLSSDRQLSDADYEKVIFLVDSWLQATTHETALQPSNAGLSKAQEGRRPMTLSEKIFTEHMLPGKFSKGVKAGDVIRVSVDWILGSEVSWKGMVKTIDQVGAKQIWRNDRFWLVGDHIVDPRNKHLPNVKALVDKSEKAQKDYKLTEYQGQNYTILHTEFVRERAQPGMLAIGSDSHTCSAGAVGCMGIGLGAADVAMSLLTGVSWFRVPESIRIHVTGEPAFGIGGKDVILHILGELKRNTVAADRIVEFGGPGTKYLSCDDRFAICNMCTEFGAITGLFVPDTVVQGYIDRRKRKLHKTESLYFRPDDNAVYADSFEIDLNKVQSYIALYPSPDNVVPVRECDPIAFDGVFIGACTTTEEDLILGALVLQVGLHENIPLKRGKRHVVFGSLPITKRLRELGIVDIYKQAGFEQSAPGCSFCVGMGADQAGAGETWLSSQNRNFKNRMGRGSFGNISSAAVVAASSFTMSLVDPGPSLEKISARSTSTTQAGDNLLNMKTNESDQETDWIISSKVQTLGDFIDTDALAPSQYFMNYETDEDIAQHCLEHTHPEFRDAVRSGRKVVVVGEAFGCGSSREGAPRALMGLGVQCVIAKSFAFIYGRNQPTLGLLGITMRDPSFYEAASDGADIKIDVHKREICIGQQKWRFDLDGLEIKMLQNKGLAEAYKRFGKNVYDSLCDEDTGPVKNVDVEPEHVDKSLEW